MRCNPTVSQNQRASAHVCAQGDRVRAREITAQKATRQNSSGTENDDQKDKSRRRERAKSKGGWMGGGSEK